MAYKTILVHFDSEPRVKTLSAYAMALAEQHEAHLIGLAVLPSFADVPPAETGTRALIDDLRDAYRADAARMQAVFETRGPIQTISTEWCLADPGFRQTADAVAEQGQAADLIVASQDNPDWRADGFRDAAGLLAIEASRPVLLVPHQGYPAGPAKRVVVAWDGSREATRATFDALPMLQGAHKVTLISIQSWQEREGALAPVRQQQGEDICDALSRHGVDCALNLETPWEDGIGQTLLGAAERHSADLLVMGGYGHSRLREMVFGGVTRHVLRHMNLPVLLVH